MPPPAYAYLNEDALLWAKAGVDDYGEPTVSFPVQIEVRWENRQTVMRNPQGDPITVDATVVAYEEIEVGSLMWEGGFDDVPGSGTGSDQVPESDLMEVVAFETMMDLRGIVQSRRYGLKFFRETAPRYA